MSSGVAFLTRLSLIAGKGASDEARASQAAALVRAYETALYSRLGMARSSRPTTRAKEIANEAFEDLRRRVFKAELGAPADAAAVFATARDQIEMVRRALALRVTNDGEAVKSRSTDATIDGGSISSATVCAIGARSRQAETPSSTHATCCSARSVRS